MKIEVGQDVLDDLYARLKRTRWPDEMPGAGWSRGADLSFMKELVAYWLDEYDWRKQETQLNTFNHFKADVVTDWAFISFKRRARDLTPCRFS